MNTNLNNTLSTTVTKYKSISNDIRAILIRKVTVDLQGIADAARELGINESTAASIIYVYNSSSRIEKIHKGGNRKCLLNDEILLLIESHIEKNRATTLKKIQTYLSESGILTVSINTIKRGLQKLKITLKRTYLLLDRVNDPERVELRRIYALDFLTNTTQDNSKIFFVDESSFNLHLKRKMGRSRVGERVYLTVPVVRGRNITLISAINGAGVVYYELISGGVDSERFKSFLSNLDRIISGELNIDGGVIIMDNARPHTSTATSDHIASLNSQVKFLSPYSYMLNPIEFSFSKIKSVVRQLDLTSENAHEMIVRGIESITTEDCEGWYRFMRRNAALAVDNHLFN